MPEMEFSVQPAAHRPLPTFLTWRALCLLFIACHFGKPIAAQQFLFHQFTPEDGLPSSAVYDIAQDREAVLWIGTENGLCRFDGQQFNTYTVEHGLPNNVVHGVKIDWRGRKWLSSFSPQPAYFLDGKGVTPEWALPFQMRSFSISTTPDSLVWFAWASPESGNKSESTLVLFPNDSLVRHPLLKSSHTGLIFDKEGRALSLSGPVGYVLEGDLVVDSIVYPPDIRPVGCVDAGDAFYCRQNVFGNEKRMNGPSVFRMDYALQQIGPVFADYESYFRKGNLISSFADRSGNLWFGLRNGLLFLPRQAGAFGTPRLLLPGVFVNVIFQDHEGNIWLGTAGEGLFFLASTEILSFNGEQSLPTADIRALANDRQGCVYIGYNTGIVAVLGPEMEVLFNRKVSDRRIVYFLPQGDRTWIASDGQLYYLTADFQLSEISGGVHGALKSMASDDDDDDLYLFSYGIHRFRQGEMTQLPFPLGSRIYASYVHNDSLLWLGTTQGLLEYEPQHAERVALFDDDIYADVRAIRCDADHTFWVGTLGLGIFLIRNGRIVRTLTTEDGLSSNMCNDILIDGPFAWVATNQGISRIDRATLEVAVYNSKDGLGSQEVNYLAKGADRIFAATDKGAISFPASLEAYQDPPLLHLGEVRMGPKQIPPDRLEGPLEFGHHVNDLYVQYVGISYKSLGDIEYAYRLEGIDKNWILTRSLFATWSSLPPGDYLFRLKAKGKSTDWSAERAFRFTIRPPWWLTWNFLVPAIFLALGGVFGIFWVVVRDLQRRNRILRQLQGFELTALRAQMNPHFMFNSLNSIQEFINRNDKHSANTYLTRFAALIRSILNTSSEDRILLSEEIRQLENYLELEKLRLEGSLDYEVKVDPLIDPDWTFLPTMLIQPYVENAILHGLFHKTGPKRLELSFTRLDEQLLLCRITDNGIGRKLAASIKLERYGRHQSMGSSMTGQRMELLQKLQKQPVSVRIVDLEDPSTGAPLGTEVELTIPEINP